jgi:starch synthase
MPSKKVLFITTEIFPYLPETEMSLVARRLPEGIHDRGKEIRTFMPKFGCINERRNQLHEVIRLSGLNIIIDESDHQLVIKVASIQSARMQIYFIDNEDFFRRKFLLADDKGNEFEDNDDRSIFYVRGVIETVRKLRWAPDIIHCHGWITALAPLFIRKHYRGDPCFKHSKIVYSIYDDAFKKPMRENFAKKVKIEGVSQNDVKGLKEKPDYRALTRLAIDYSDGVIASSPRIDSEIEAYCRQKEKLSFLSWQPEEKFIQKTDELYNQLLGI